MDRVQKDFFHALYNQQSLASGTGLQSFSVAAVERGGPTIPAPKIRVLDAISGETSAKLVEMSPDDITALRMQDPGARVVPVVYYKTCDLPPEEICKSFQPAAGCPCAEHRGHGAKCRGRKTDRGSQGSRLYRLFFREGASDTTNAAGKASLSFGASSIAIERLYVYPKLGYWGLFKQNVTLHSGQVEELRPITFPVSDLLDKIYGPGVLTDGDQVTVAVIDTGSGPHPDLNVAGGESTVLGDVKEDYHDNGDMHGTHVAGIIAARGTALNGRMGVAPGVTLYSYRVFERGKRASNFAIAKAIDRAAHQGCHLINMSLGGGSPDPVISSAIADARNMGAVVVVSAGNDGRKPVSFPANDPRAIAISAMGRIGTFPSDSVDASNVQSPFSTLNPNDFIASFSNIGLEIQLTGTGVGIISTVPGGYAVMSGTSMACPAVVGCAARLLGHNLAIINQTADQSRSDAITRLLFAAAKSAWIHVRPAGPRPPSITWLVSASLSCNSSCGYTGEGPAPTHDMQRLRTADGLRIIEESGRMVLLEAPYNQIDELASQFPGWVSSPVRSDIELPDPRPMPNKPPRETG